MAALAAGLVAVLAIAGCGASTPTGSTPPTPSPAVSPGAPTATDALASVVPTHAPTSPTPGGFAFDADAIVAYYDSLGYTCTESTPDPKAAGFDVRSCSLVDPAGRTRVVAVVTDSNGSVADGVASLQGAASETILDTTVALEPLSAFLGAMLGAEPGAALVPWLAGHLGDSRAETASGTIAVTTYTDGPDAHAKLYVELAAPAYLAAARSPAP